MAHSRNGGPYGLNFNNGSQQSLNRPRLVGLPHQIPPVHLPYHSRPPPPSRMHHGPPYAPAMHQPFSAARLGPQNAYAQQQSLYGHQHQHRSPYYTMHGIQPDHFDGLHDGAGAGHNLARMPVQQPESFRAVPPPSGPPVFSRDRFPGPPSSVSTLPSGVSKTDFDPSSIVTIFVGNIDERVSEQLMKKLLGKCGRVANWKRVHGANNKLQAFGFCEFLDAESALRGARLLDQMRMGVRDLQVKIGNKCHPLVLAFKERMRAQIGPSAEEDDVDQSTLMRDQVVRDEISITLEEHEEELNKDAAEDGTGRTLTKRVNTDGGIEEIEMEEDKRQLINREILNFRETYKGSDEVLEERIKAAGRAQIQFKDLEGRQSPEANSKENTPSASPESSYKETRKSRSLSVSSSHSIVSGMAMPIKRQNNKRLLEQEKQYQEQLEEWLAREKQLTKERGREDEREKENRWNERKTASRLIRVYEDYDDDRMDEEYYSGSNLSRLLKDRKKELETDLRDREKEEEILRELRQQLVSERHPSPEVRVRQLELQQNQHIIPLPYDQVQLLANDVMQSSEPKSSEEIVENTETCAVLDLAAEGRDVTCVSFTTAPLKFVPRNGTLFKNSDDEGAEEEQIERRKRLFRYDGEMEKKRAVCEARKQQTRKLIESIPASKEELFDYSVAWEVLDKVKSSYIKCAKQCVLILAAYAYPTGILSQSLMEVRVKPWISKKIQEYIGEEEPTLVEFISQKISAKATPRSVVSDISMVLDEDAEVFVMKLWRLLVYETEMKKMGITGENLT